MSPIIQTIDLDVTSRGGAVDHGGVVAFHKLSDTSSRMAVQVDGVPEGVLETLGAATHVPEAGVRRELESMQNYLEERGTADGAWRGDV